MGCKGSKSYDIVVDYNGIRRQMTGTLPDFSELNEWIFNQYPGLRYHAISLKVNSIPLKSQTEYSYISKSTDSLNITLSRVKSQIETNLGIVKICNKVNKSISTGFLINKQYILLSKIYYNIYSPSDLQVFFPDDLQLSFNIDKQAIEIGEYFIVAALSDEVTNFESVSLKSELHDLEESFATVFYYSSKLPILQKYTGKFKAINTNFIESPIVLDEGSVGSPIFSGDSKLIGVFSSSNQVLTSKFISENFKNPSILSGFNSFFQTSAILSDNFPLTTCYIDSFDKKLTYYSPEETINKSVMNIDLITGSTASICTYGIILIGSSSTNEPIVRLFDGYSLKKLANTNRSHIFHCTAILNDEVYVISGNTAAVEVYCFKRNSWSMIAELSKKRSMATAVVVEKIIYVVGGRRDEKLLRSIVIYKEKIWQKCRIMLPIGLVNVGCIVSKDDILVFGGESLDGRNKESWKINESEITEERVSVLHTFGRFPVFYDENEYLVFTNNGVLLRFDAKTKRFLILSVDEEILTVNYDQ